MEWEILKKDHKKNKTARVGSRQRDSQISNKQREEKLFSIYIATYLSSGLTKKKLKKKRGTYAKQNSLWSNWKPKDE